MGSQSMTELRMNTMPLRETVAGDALSMLCTSKMILQLGAMVILSPLARVSVLLSSSTELRFSIQMASTGPSNSSQTCSPWWCKRHYCMVDSREKQERTSVQLNRYFWSTVILKSRYYASMDLCYKKVKCCDVWMNEQ